MYVLKRQRPCAGGCPIFAVIILISSVANALGWIAM